MAGDIYAARKSAALVFAGKTLFIEEGVTLAREGHPILDAAPEMFEPVFVHFEVDAAREEAPAPPARVEPPTPPTPPQGDIPADPAAKDVRAWAAENGIDVPARGKLPAEVVEQYQAAQQGA